MGNDLAYTSCYSKPLFCPEVKGIIRSASWCLPVSLSVPSSVAPGSLYKQGPDRSPNWPSRQTGTCLSIKLAVSSPDPYQFLKGKKVKVKRVTSLGTSELINRKFILRLQNKDLLDKHWKNKEGTD